MTDYTILFLVFCYATFPQIYGYGVSYHNEQIVDTIRVSEQKCKEYSSLVYEKTVGISLSLEPLMYSETTPKCVYESTGLIVGGVQAKLGEFPHMAAIGWELGKDTSFSCGGSLISARFVLTAAHCTKTRGTPNPYPSIVRLGDLNINPDVDDGAQPVDVRISKIYVHPNYKRKLKYNDIALLELEKDVKFTDHIRPACLWTSNSFGEASTALAIGWGVTNSTTLTTAEILQKVSLDLLDNAYCNETLSSTFYEKWNGFSDSQLCAGVDMGQKDTCQGDSGSPLQITLKDNKCIFYVIGVTAKGKTFCGFGPAIYTRVSEYLDWIEGIVWPEFKLEDS